MFYEFKNIKRLLGLKVLFNTNMYLNNIYFENVNRYVLTIISIAVNYVYGSSKHLNVIHHPLNVGSTISTGYM